ncbi:Uncharacterized protein OBRU01_26420, partial [Operophtera brumata]
LSVHRSRVIKNKLKRRRWCMLAMNRNRTTGPCLRYYCAYHFDTQRQQSMRWLMFSQYVNCSFFYVLKGTMQLLCHTFPLQTPGDSVFLLRVLEVELPSNTLIFMHRDYTIYNSKDLSCFQMKYKLREWLKNKTYNDTETLLMVI